MTSSASGRGAAVLALLAWLLAGCGGGGGDASASAALPDVLISGTVTFDRVPTVQSTSSYALDYLATAAAPARGVTVEARTGGTVLASGVTDSSGRYALSVPANTAGVRIRAAAEMRREGTPAWTYRVVNNTQGNSLYVLESGVLAVGGADQTVDMHAASGWDGASYSAPRAAAPFAILDVVRDATLFVLDAAPQAVFPELVLHWSPDNIPAFGPGDEPDFASGEIGTSLFRSDQSGFGIFLLGAAGSDTDEYDRHVIAHEWAHYLEHALGRSDSIGGPHTRGDQLDMRVAFSEGFANAFAAMVTGDPLYIDVLGPAQAHGFAFDVEGPYVPSASVLAAPNPNPGWFSEESIQEIVYDLYDDAQDLLEDDIALGLEPLLEVLTGPMREGAALTSIFAFADGLRGLRPDLSGRIDALLAAHDVGPFTDAFGTGETNAGEPENPQAVEPGDIIPVYEDLPVDGVVNVCSTDAYTYLGPAGFYNKLGSRAFVKVTASEAAAYLLAAATTSVPFGAGAADPDMVLWRNGLPEVSEAAPDAACVAGNVAECAERFERFLGPGDYVLEVYEWTNTQPPNGPDPPIGRTCFDVTVTRR